MSALRTVGDGTRILNFLIDLLLVFLLSMLAYRTWNWYVFYWKYTHILFGWFLGGVAFLYYFFWEWICAKTPGKFFTGTRVVSQNGGKPSFLGLVLRSLLRISLIDAFFLPFVGMPLHDWASGTRLVSE
ncbi:MAG: hypothetical protein EAZ62_06565 [Sphingobacteriia bacterium]|nr:MAG: hypothetical protein EAZ62_06565 [Sphingobacteriia bacterium]